MNMLVPEVRKRKRITSYLRGSLGFMMIEVLCWNALGDSGKGHRAASKAG